MEFDEILAEQNYSLVLVLQKFYQCYSKYISLIGEKYTVYACEETRVFACTTAHATTSRIASFVEIDFNGIIRYPWRSATRNFKYESRARENVANYPFPCPAAAAHTSDVLTIARSHNRFVRRAVLLRTASRHIVRIPWLRYGRN